MSFDFRLLSFDFRLLSSDFRVQTSDFRVPIYIILSVLTGRRHNNSTRRASLFRLYFLYTLYFNGSISSVTVMCLHK